jgi:hypothetical protein
LQLPKDRSPAEREAAMGTLANELVQEEVEERAAVVAGMVVESVRDKATAVASVWAMDQALVMAREVGPEQARQALLAAQEPEAEQQETQILHLEVELKPGSGPVAGQVQVLGAE